MIKSYKDLDVWNRAIDLVKRVYALTKDFPKQELYGLANQMCRSAVSIPSNIAEGKMRQHVGEYAQFLYIALGSCAELDTQLTIAKQLKYIDEKTNNETSEEIDHISRMTRNLIKSLREPIIDNRKPQTANRKLNIIRQAVVLVFTGLFLFYELALALPAGQEVESGTATFDSPDASTLNITASDKTVINFNSFSIAQNESVNFIQPSTSSSVLSRVVGDSPSIISGSLTANGILFLANPNGIHFTPTAQVHVNSLIASTLDISTNNFINQNYIFEHNNKFSQVLNQGVINAISNVALIGSSVANTGIIQAQAGTVHLASGDKTTVNFDRRGLIQVEINEKTSGKVIDLNGNTVKDAVANSGSITATQVIMTAQTASDIFENAVNQTGIIKATGFVEENGIIKVRGNQNIQVSGKMERVSSLRAAETHPSLRAYYSFFVVANYYIMLYINNLR